MLRRFAAAAALIALAGCAGMESAGRNATHGNAPAYQPPPSSAPAYLPPPSAQAQSSAPAYAPPVQQAQVQSSVAAPSVAAPAAPPPAAPPNDDVVVTAPERLITPPNGDTRSVSEQREDVHSWDECIMDVQRTYASDPTEPQTESPEDVCRRQLGMASRNAVPASRMVRRR